MKLSIKALIIAGALFKTVCFLFISVLNLLLRPYGGAYLAMLTSLYPGYDPVSGPIFASLPAGSYLSLGQVVKLHTTNPELFAWCR